MITFLVFSNHPLSSKASRSTSNLTNTESKMNLFFGTTTDQMRKSVFVHFFRSTSSPLTIIKVNSSITNMQVDRFILTNFVLNLLLSNLLWVSLQSGGMRPQYKRTLHSRKTFYLHRLGQFSFLGSFWFLRKHLQLP